MSPLAATRASVTISSSDLALLVLVLVEVETRDEEELLLDAIELEEELMDRLTSQLARVIRGSNNKSNLFFMVDVFSFLDVLNIAEKKKNGFVRKEAFRDSKRTGK